MLKVAQIPYGLGSHPQALRWLTRGLLVLGDRDDDDASGQRAALAAWYGAVRWKQGHQADAISGSRKAIEEGERLRRTRGARARVSRAGHRARRARALRGGRVLWARAGDLRVARQPAPEGHHAQQPRNTVCTSSVAGTRRSRPTRLPRRRSRRQATCGQPRLRSPTGRSSSLDQGRLEEAEPLLRQALPIARASGTGPHIANNLADYGRLAARAGRFDEARAMLTGGEGNVRTSRRARRGPAHRREARRMPDARRRERGGPGACLVGPRSSLDDRGGLCRRPCSGARARLCARPARPVGRSKPGRSPRASNSARANGVPYEVGLTLDALVRLGPSVSERVDEFALERDEIFATLHVVATPEIPLDAAVATTD